MVPLGAPSAQYAHKMIVQVLNNPEHEAQPDMVEKVDDGVVNSKAWLGGI